MKVKAKFSGRDIVQIVPCLRAACGNGNRWPGVSGLRLDRTRRTLEPIFEAIETERTRRIREDGVVVVVAGEDVHQILEGSDAHASFMEYIKGAHEEIHDVLVETVAEEDVEGAWHRDPISGKKESGLNMDPGQVGELARAGLIVECERES